MALQRIVQDFRAVYGWHEEYRRGRSIILLSGVLTAISNALTTGIFNTAFLRMYDIDLVGVGIISFIAPVANLFVVFSPLIVEKIQRRKPVLLTVTVCQYFLTIVATTLMPQFVQDSQGRIICFCILQFLASVTGALFSTGYTPWWSNFLPKDDKARVQYFAYNQFFAVVAGSLVPFITGMLTTAVSDSAEQNKLILLMRYIGFGLAMVDVLFKAMAKEYPYPEVEHPRLTDILWQPLRNRKFVMCMSAIALHTLIGNLCSDTWDYYILNDVGLSYARINTIVSLGAPIQLLLLPLWKKVVIRLGWVRTLGLAMMLLVPAQIAMSLLTLKTDWIWIPARIWQLVVVTGITLASTNMIYLHLPKKSMAVYIGFNTLLTQVAMFAGKALGLFIVTRVDALNLSIFGFPFSGSQCAETLHYLIQFPLGVVLFVCWRTFTSQENADVSMMH